MGKILCYLYENMADFEVSFLLHRLRNSGKKEVIGIAGDMGRKMAQSGLSYQPDLTIEQVRFLTDVEALIIPGGPINNEQNEINNLAEELLAEGKLVAAICFGPQFLGRAGILDDHKYTTSCSPSQIREMGVKDPYPRQNYVIQRVVKDRNLITAQGYAFVDFAEAICDYFNLYPDPKEKEPMIGRVTSDFAGEWDDEDFPKEEKVEDVSKEEESVMEEVIAYVDGSFNNATKEFAYGVVIVKDSGEETFYRKMNDPDLATMHNVAGEIKGAEAAMQYALDHQAKSLVIYHDYEGIAKWCLGLWKTNKDGTKAYKTFYEEAKKKMEIRFVKVTGHSGDKYNDMADKLAKKALGIV